IQSRANQKAAERETFGNLVDTESAKQRPLCRIHRRRFNLNSQSQTIGGAVNRQSDDKGGGDLAEVLSGVSIEMAGRASRTNMVNMFAYEKEQRVPSGQRQ